MNAPGLEFEPFSPLVEPDERGRFGEFGGKFAPEVLMPALEELEAAWRSARVDPVFLAEFHGLLADFVGRPSPVYEAKRLSNELGGARLVFKREDLNHTGAHKINNALGQCLLVKKMGKHRVIAETGAGQHGVATATACALLELECVIYMGRVDTERQAVNVERMKMLGATVVPVDQGTRTLKDAVNEAMRDWVTNVRDTHYVLGTAYGPHPFPWMVREFQRVIGREARAQILAKFGKLPACVTACVGGGSNAIGVMWDFLTDPVRLVGVEAGGRSMGEGEHAARFATGSVGIFQGSKSYLLQDAEGQVLGTHSVSAGLDYASVGAEHAWLHDMGRVEYTFATDDQALEAFHRLARTEGILPALESSHAVAWAIAHATDFSPSDILLVNLSGRGDKDLHTVMGAARV
ncbi:MAG: tryptophan synthase subunit beta [Fibrobacterota bacterium]|nr:MAG: tryptophan synthase subunit beta [Fibrobacterota bacterium]